MLLCLDCGNTRLKWGLTDTATNAPWLGQGALALPKINHLPAEIARLPKPKQIVGCCVAGPEIRAALETVARILDVPLLWNESRAAQCGVRNGYEHPGQLGADRWAALIGARHLHAGNGLVVNAGTATTVDVLDADGLFRGGIILPGLDLMRTSLARGTAALPPGGGGFSFHALPGNTRNAIASGCLLATAGAIDRMYAQVAAAAAPLCLLSGGAAAALAPLLDIPLRRVDNLVLEGLACIGRSPQFS